MKKQITIAVSLLFSIVSAQAQIITTFAGTGTAGFSGDGTAATNAQLNTPMGVCSDGTNVYIADWNNYRIRKINTSGIITTEAGTGVLGFSGDGNPATTAEIGWVFFPASQGGNLYLPDNWNSNMRKVGATGIISTITGNGVAAYTGDGGAATIAA